MIKGFIVITVPLDCRVDRISYSSRTGRFTCPGHIGALEHSFVPTADLDFDGDMETLESLVSHYSAEVSGLKDRIMELESLNSSLEKEAEVDQNEIKDLRDTVVDLEAFNDDLRTQVNKEKGLFNRWKKDSAEAVRNYSNKLSKIESLLEQSRASNQALNQKLKETVTKVDSLTFDNTVLTERITEMKCKNDETVDAYTKIRMEYTDLVDVLARRNGYIMDLENTNKHLRNEQTGLKKIDVRSIVEAFLQYFTDVCNLAFDKTDLEELRNALDIRSEQLEMNLRALGVILQYHARGDDLTNERVDIQSVTTDRPDLSGKVKRTDRFGCKFNSDYVADLPESITVYEYRSESMKSEQINTRAEMCCRILTGCRLCRFD